MNDLPRERVQMYKNMRSELRKQGEVATPEVVLALLTIGLLDEVLTCMRDIAKTHHEMNAAVRRLEKSFDVALNRPEDEAESEFEDDEEPETVTGDRPLSAKN